MRKVMKSVFIALLVSAVGLGVRGHHKTTAGSR